ncbi:MAG: YtxH domain-containing protein [bacterium]
MIRLVIRIIRVFFLGIIGFVAGILLAPWKGEESRKKVQDAVEKGKAKFEEIKGQCCGGSGDDCCEHKE